MTISHHFPPVNFLVMDGLYRGGFGRQSGDLSETFGKTRPYVTGKFTARKTMGTRSHPQMIRNRLIRC
ncbi:MAG: hypothetical protein HC866_24655 [Leptolyngbyaceae cyanobacterium RU_5_1]|nr:hypothetical protein [Leptolyngbyaceae cyanobacterium RU_5_1]